MTAYLGFDTSCYTTSVAAIDAEGRLRSDRRQVLSVRPGGRGLQQSGAVFQHLQNLPDLAAAVLDDLGGEPVAGVGASTRPRDQEGSYMPVFRVGEGFGRTVARALQVPFRAADHQTGHLQSGLWSAGCPDLDHFLALHLSGGTTELLRVTRSGSAGLSVTILGGSTDLHAGQFVDRVGVALGLPFPAGPHLEELAKGGEPGRAVIPSAVTGCSISFSGPEACAQRLVHQGESKADIALAVQRCLVQSLVKILRAAMSDCEESDVLLVGGVASNQYIKEQLGQIMTGVRLHFADPRYASDNAVGIALEALSPLGGQPDPGSSL